MTVKADTTTSALQIVVDGITSPVAGDVQIVELATVTGATMSVVGAANPLSVNERDGGYTDENGNALTIQRAFANVAASSTDQSIVGATASKKVRVLQALVICGGTATSVTFNSKGGGAGTAISPALANGANGGEVLPFSQIGWLETNAGEGLTVTTGAGSATGVLVAYVLV